MGFIRFKHICCNHLKESLNKIIYLVLLTSVIKLSGDVIQLELQPGVFLFHFFLFVSWDRMVLQQILQIGEIDITSIDSDYKKIQNYFDRCWERYCGFWMHTCLFFKSYWNIFWVTFKKKFENIMYLVFLPSIVQFFEGSVQFDFQLRDLVFKSFSFLSCDLVARQLFLEKKRFLMIKKKTFSLLQSMETYSIRSDYIIMWWDHVYTWCFCRASSRSLEVSSSLVLNWIFSRPSSSFCWSAILLVSICTWLEKTDWICLKT